MRPIHHRLLALFPLGIALLALLLTLGWIGLGFSTPRPPGVLFLALEAATSGDFEPALPGPLQAGADSSLWFRAAAGPFAQASGLEVSLREIAGSGTGFYGLRFGAPGSPERWLALISRDHFVAVYHDDGDQREGLWEPTRFPAVKPPGDSNRLRVDLYPERFELRINEELVAAFPWEASREVDLHVGVETGPEAWLEVAVESLRVWQIP